MTTAIDETNDAHKVLQARSTIRDDIKARLSAIEAELDAIDQHACKNQGHVSHPPQVARPAVDVLLDKVSTEAALKEAERRVATAQERFNKKKTAE